MSTHAKFSPSSASRWMNCTASPMLTKDYPRTSSDAADRGTCYHEVAELMLRHLTSIPLAARYVTKGEFTRAFKFAYNTVNKYGTDTVSSSDAKRLMNWTEAENSAKAYVEWIIKEFGLAISKGAPFAIEGQARIFDEMWGTVDFHIQVGSIIHIVDLKTGRWPVSSKNNDQMMTYASGLVTFSGQAVSDVELVIFQDDYADRHTVPVAVVARHHNRLSEIIIEAHDGGETKPGEWCKFCDHKPNCQAYGERAILAAQNEFKGIDKIEPENTIATISGNLAADMLNSYAMIEGWMKTALPILAERAYKEGFEVPGYKVVRGIKHKAWIDKDVAERKLGDDGMKKTIITPNQAIKRLGGNACEGLWTIPTGEIKLVTEGTRGVPVTASAQIEFAD